MSELYPADPANPALTEEQMHPVLAAAWGIDGTLTSLGSMQDQNYRVRTADGALAVAKISGLHTPAAALELQNAAMRHVAARRAGFASPEPIATRDGDYLITAVGHRIRLLSWVEGIPLADRGYLGEADLVELGRLAARVGRALDGFSHNALSQASPWDLRLAGDVLAESHEHLPADWAPHLDRAIATFESVDGAGLPEVVAHADLTPVNTVCLPGDELRSRPVGVLDFGDVMRTWRIGDVAASAVGAAEHPGTGDTLGAVLAVLAGYHEVCPLTEDEADAFWPLLVTRAAVTAAMSHRQLARNADNGYAEAAVRSGVRALRRLAAIPPALARVATRARLGFEPVAGAAAALARLREQPTAPLVDGLADLPVLDLSARNPDLPPQVAPPAITRWAEARLTDEPAFEAPATLQLGATVHVPDGTPVAAPIAGTVAALDPLVLDLGTALRLQLGGVAADGTLRVGGAVEAGTRLGTAAPGPVHVQLAFADGLPGTGLAAHRSAWAALCPDPSPILGRDVAAPDRHAAALRKRRAAAVARPQHLYYEQPPEIVRGWRHFLYDADGRCYLDMINNIASVGHSHPRVTEAAVRQLRMLNTNSRFLYDAMATYAERIAALLPAELDSVFLVNSGSEAADLAVQLAQRFTGRRDVVALAGAYHGWTGAVIDISTSPMDRPNWRAELPDWVHVADQPDTYRGSGDAETYRASVRAACAAAVEREGAAGTGGPAAFLSEPLLGNQGALELPPGYLRGVYADVRAAGGLCIADEVQVGLGRTGETFWAFEHEDVVPDIVFTAKAAGNGHPLGVVVCRREIAETFDGQTAYFSSTGGGPVSCAIGLAVLDVIRDEGLQRNAREVGRHLKQRLVELAGRHPLIGAVHGRGLYLGVDLVLDPELRTPARFEALAVSERLRALGVIMQPTGDAFNVLKVKPPLCLDESAADYFVAALDEVLTNFT